MRKDKVEYKEYLNSKEWSEKKEQFRNRSWKNRRCYLCGSTKDLNIHHNSYSDIGNEKLVDLVALCREHHELLHRLQKSHKWSYRFTLKVIKLAIKENSTNYDQIEKNIHSGKYNIPLYPPKTKKPDYIVKYLKEREKYYPDHPAICNCEECKSKLV